MVATNLTSLQVAGVPTMGMAGIPTTTGNVWFVNSVSGSNGNTGQADNPFSTLDYAIGRCTASTGDVIVLAAGHAETVASASAITCDVAGVQVVGLGEGANRPRFTFSATSSTIVISAASFQFGNLNAAGENSIVLAPSIDAVVSPLVISGASCTVYVEHQDATDLIESTRVILTTAAADNLTVYLKHVGFTSGSGSTNAIRLVGCNNAVITADFYGLVGALGWVEFTTPASSNVQVYGYMYPSGSTNLSRDVVDTVTGSTWFASFYDGAAGAWAEGGSGAALATTSVATVAANQTVPTADSTANTLERDVVGNKTDAAVYTAGTTKSLVAYAKGVSNTVDHIATSATAVMVTGDTIFTVSGGPVLILSLVSECITANDTTASTVQYGCTVTGLSAATFSAASGSIASAATHATVSLVGTALSTAANYSATGVNLGQTTGGGIVMPVGIITVTIAIGSTTGTWRHICRYRPMVVGATVA